MARFLDPDVRLLFDDLNAHMAPRFRKLNHALAELVYTYSVLFVFLRGRLYAEYVRLKPSAVLISYIYNQGILMVLFHKTKQLFQSLVYGL